MRLRKIIQDYFSFSRKERNGLLVLLMLIILFSVANHLLFLFEDDGAFSPDESWELQFVDENQNREQKQEKSLFFFNPNTIDSLAIDSLAIPSKIKQNILKYRSKGGRFFSAEDLSRIYGMTDSLYQVLKEYVQIDDPKTKHISQSSIQKSCALGAFCPDTCSENDWHQMGLSEDQSRRMFRFCQAVGHFKSKKQLLKFQGIPKNLMDSLLKYMQIDETISQGIASRALVVELNSADSLLLKQLPGVGVVLCRRIIKYRDLLGGFYQSSQLLEVYGFKNDIFSRVESLVCVDTTTIRKMNLNFIDYKELSRHPYVGKELSRKIVSYRARQGSIQNNSDLVKNGILDRGQYEKLRPYFETKKE